jgi:two-component system, chemotaxis family, sensor kinase CheA
VSDGQGDPVLRELLAGFLVEAEGLAAKVTQHLLDLERSGGGRAFDDLARGLHTLKGSAATIGLDELADLAHRMEDAVLPLRGRGGTLPPALADALLRSLDAFLAHVRALAGKATDPQPLEPLRALLTGAALEALQPRPAITPAPPHSKAVTKPDLDLPQAPRPLPPVPEGTPPAPEGHTAPPIEEGWRVQPHQVVALLSEVERLRELKLRVDERRRELERGLALLSRLGLLAQTAEARALLSSVSRALVADGEEAGDLVSAFEEGLKQITTLPVRSVLEPLRRAVRDLCKATGKEARLEVAGAEVSLDRRVLEALRGPLVQLVRNAVDHGLEPPDEREAKGKHREGAITVRVEQQGNQLFLEVADDGRGLDEEKIRASAVRLGLLSEEEARAALPQQLFQLVFRPGFTTREEVSAVSGRGVGLDLVRSQVLDQRGQVEVQSTWGQGTRFLLSLPADLGSSPLLVVRAGEQLAGVPMAAIESSLRARPEHVAFADGGATLDYREELLRLEDLGARLGLRAELPAQAGAPVLVLQQQGERLALLVDEVLGDKDLTVRPLPPEARDLPAWQGAATLAGGELLLVLRPEWLVRPQDDGPRARPARSLRALVVDDSLTARALHRTALESGGYQVHLASSARQALQLLGSGAYDVLVCDVAMEAVDGLALTRHLRERPETRGLAIILVSAHDSPEGRTKGLLAGADGFLSKRDCASGRLLAEVAQVIARRKEAP